MANAGCRTYRSGAEESVVERRKVMTRSHYYDPPAGREVQDCFSARAARIISGLMSKRADRPRRDRHPPTSTSALARLIDTPHLAQVVSRLTPDVLHQVIRHHGLEACGALVAAATPQQVRAILDLDLWRPAVAGGAEQFDAARFGAWLDALMEEGETVAARVIAEMDEGLAIAGLSRHVRVFDPGIFEPTFSSDDDLEWSDLKSSEHTESEIGGYVIRDRSLGRGWTGRYVYGDYCDGTLRTQPRDCFSRDDRPKSGDLV
jgi:hypothetical protein